MTAFFVLCGSAVLFVCDRYSARKKRLERITWKDALVIGVAQVIAFVPGVSRSGMTISGGRLCGMHRADAARFSFLIATPIICGAGLMAAKDVVAFHVTHIVVIGVVVSFITSFITIHYFLALIQKVSYAVFVYYAIAFFASVWMIFLVK